MKELSVLEEIILTSILKLKDNAYGVTIRKKVVNILKRNLFYGTLYNALDQLVKKDYIQKKHSEPVSSRGGRSKILYNLTPKGILALKEARELQKLIWEDVPEVINGEG